MYEYDSADQAFVNARVEQFRDQTARYLNGTLSEEAFRPLRLQNGLYIQRHAPMLRIAIPYGTLSADQLDLLADVADDFDDGYGHFSTRQNLQLNGPKLAEIPDLLARLAGGQMHAIQTSGNCIRNVTTDQFAGIAADEIVDPRAIAELIRQWSSLHPEFAYLPRKFKIAVSGSTSDRAAMVHDVGIAVRQSGNGPDSITVDVYAGGGLGRTPVIAHKIRRDLPAKELLNYLEAILRVYNQLGRRDNLYKARIKILVNSLGVEHFTEHVEREFSALQIDGTGPGIVPDKVLTGLLDQFGRSLPPDRETEQVVEYESQLASRCAARGEFARWIQRSRHPHKVPGYTAISISLKNGSQAPGDMTSAQMRLVAAMARNTGFPEIRVTHHQNLVLPSVPLERLESMYDLLRKHQLASPNIGLLTDIIACPGGDFCSLANAVSIPIALAIQETFDDLDLLFDIGELELNISGCMNSCGHHHIGHIGILGVDKKGDAFYQVSIGGSQGRNARVGKILGPSFAENDIPDVIENLIRTYLKLRKSKAERFVDVVCRTGITPFKEAVYVSVS